MPLNPHDTGAYEAFMRNRIKNNNAHLESYRRVLQAVAKFTEERLPQLGTVSMKFREPVRSEESSLLADMDINNPADWAAHSMLEIADPVFFTSIGIPGDLQNDAQAYQQQSLELFLRGNTMGSTPYNAASGLREGSAVITPRQATELAPGIERLVSETLARPAENRSRSA